MPNPLAADAQATVSHQHLDRSRVEALLAEAHGPLVFDHCSFDGEDFEEVALRGASFRSCTFAAARFSHAVLSGTSWEKSRAAAASFDMADLTDARFSGCDLNNTSWRRAKLAGASFSSVKLTGGKFEEVRALGLVLKDSLAVSADLRGLSFRKQTVVGLNLAEADLAGCDFSDATLVDCDLSGANLKNARFVRADLRRATLGPMNVGDLVRYFEGSTISISQAAQLVAALGVNVVAED